jgi:hypothetical protein
VWSSVLTHLVQDEQSKKPLIIVENEQVVYGTGVMYYT